MFSKPISKKRPAEEIDGPAENRPAKSSNTNSRKTSKSGTPTTKTPTTQTPQTQTPQTQTANLPDVQTMLELDAKLQKAAIAESQKGKAEAEKPKGRGARTVPQPQNTRQGWMTGISWPTEWICENHEEPIGEHFSGNAEEVRENIRRGLVVYSTYYSTNMSESKIPKDRIREDKKQKEKIKEILKLILGAKAKFELVKGAKGWWIITLPTQDIALKVLSDPFHCHYEKTTVITFRKARLGQENIKRVYVTDVYEDKMFRRLKKGFEDQIDRLNTLAGHQIICRKVTKRTVDLNQHTQEAYMEFELGNRNRKFQATLKTKEKRNNRKTDSWEIPSELMPTKFRTIDVNGEMVTYETRKPPFCKICFGLCHRLEICPYGKAIEDKKKEKTGAAKQRKVPRTIYLDSSSPDEAESSKAGGNNPPGDDDDDSEQESTSSEEDEDRETDDEEEKEEKYEGKGKGKAKEKGKEKEMELD